MHKTLFITGTDTGVGKTIVTALLLRHLRRRGLDALAMKPFSAGDREDARLYHRVQNGRIRLTEVNPFCFRAPVTPLVAARREDRHVSLAAALAAVQAVRARCEVLLVEGCGGLLAPLGDRFTFLDLIRGRNPRVILVASNRLGVLNHSLLTVARLREAGHARVRMALVETQPVPGTDLARATNPAVLAELLPKVPVHRIPFLGLQPGSKESWRSHGKGLEATLDELCR